MDDSSSADDRWRTHELFAIGATELMRPLFTRWGSSSAYEVYARSVDALGRRREQPDKGSSTLDALYALPEGNFDDSHYRDYYVGVGLGIVAYALRIAFGLGSEGRGHDARECELGLESLAADLGVEAIVEELRQHAVELASNPDGIAAEESMRACAASYASSVNAGLDDLARANGWSLTRARA